MSALPYFLLALPIVDLAISNPEAGDLMVAVWMFTVAWRMKLLGSDPIDRQGRQMTWEVTIEREGVAKPVCVAESISRRYP